MILSAVNSSGLALQMLSNELKNDKENVNAPVDKNYFAVCI